MPGTNCYHELVDVDYFFQIQFLFKAPKSSRIAAVFRAQKFKPHELSLSDFFLVLVEVSSVDILNIVLMKEYISYSVQP